MDANKIQSGEFAVGAELAEVSDDRDHWLDVIRVVRAWYHGTLVYAANFTEYVDVSFWDSLDLIGIDAYWSLSQRPTSDAAVLASVDKQSGWAGIFWWVWDALPDEGGDHTLNLDPRGKLAENVARRWWAY